MRTMKHWALAASAAAALALAGCGGGGSSTSGGPGTMPPMPAMVSLPPGVMVADGEHTITAGMSMDVGDVMFTCPADGEDCVVTIASGEATSMGGMATAMVSEAYTMRMAAAVKAMTKAANTKKDAIAAEAGQTADAGIGGTLADGAESTYSITISRDRDETKVMIADTAMAGDDDPKFAQAMDLGGGLTMHVRANGEGVEEVVMVSTDIEAPMGVAFAMWEGRASDGTVTMPHALTIRQDGETADSENPGDSISVAGGTDNVNLPLIMAASFAAAPPGSSSVTHTFLPAAPDADPNTDGDQPRDAATVDGTYRGADGTYTCSGSADCTVTVNDKGDLTGIAGTWIFTPDAGATSDQPDYDYLKYGFWLKRTIKDGATIYNEVETFAESSIAASTAVSAVTGSATYEGGALGVYVHSVSNPDGTEASATSGHFTADAKLTANFGGGGVAANDQFMISGTIDNFALSDHAEGPGWSVSLEDGGATDNINGDGTFSGVAKGGGADGSYSGTFRGTADADTQPHTAVGEFNANFSNGSVAGAFGARKKAAE